MSDTAAPAPTQVVVVAVKKHLSGREKSFRHDRTRIARKHAYLGHDIHRAMRSDVRVKGRRVTSRYLSATSNFMQVIACRVVAAMHDNQMTEKGECRATVPLLVAGIREVLGPFHAQQARVAAAQMESFRLASTAAAATETAPTADTTIST